MKPLPVAEPSLIQVTIVPAVTCTFVGPWEPEYEVPPTVMKSQHSSVSNSVAVIVMSTSARIVQASLMPYDPRGLSYDPMPSVMQSPLEVTSQYAPPDTIDQYGCASVPLTIRAKTMTCASRGAERRHVD